MKNKELMEKLSESLDNAGYLAAKIVSSYRTLEEPWCIKGLRAPVSVFLFTHGTLPLYPEQYVAALPIMEDEVIIGISKSDGRPESRQDLAARVLKDACQTYGCHDDPDRCLFARPLRSRENTSSPSGLTE